MEAWCLEKEGVQQYQGRSREVKLNVGDERAMGGFGGLKYFCTRSKSTKGGLFDKMCAQSILQLDLPECNNK